jgi:hypothetical protein
LGAGKPAVDIRETVNIQACQKSLRIKYFAKRAAEATRDAKDLGQMTIFFF